MLITLSVQLWMVYVKAKEANSPSTSGLLVCIGVLLWERQPQGQGSLENRMVLVLVLVVLEGGYCHTLKRRGICFSYNQ